MKQLRHAGDGRQLSLRRAVGMSRILLSYFRSPLCFETFHAQPGKDTFQTPDKNPIEVRRTDKKKDAERVLHRYVIRIRIGKTGRH